MRWRDVMLGIVVALWCGLECEEKCDGFDGRECVERAGEVVV